MVRSNGFKIQIPPSRTSLLSSLQCFIKSSVCVYGSLCVKMYVCGYLYNLYQYVSNLQLNAVDLHEKSKRIDERNMQRVISGN